MVATWCFPIIEADINDTQLSLHDYFPGVQSPFEYNGSVLDSDEGRRRESRSVSQQAADALDLIPPVPICGTTAGSTSPTGHITCVMRVDVPQSNTKT